MMCAGLWLGAQSHRSLSEEWGVSKSRIIEIAAEAHRVIRAASMGDSPEAVREKMTTQLAILQNIRLRARTRTRRKYRPVWQDVNGRMTRVYEAFEEPDPDFDAELRAVDLENRMLGMYPRQELEISGPGGGPVEVHHGIVLLPPEDPIDLLITSVSEPRPKELGPNGSNGNGSNGNGSH